jgi:RNA polymerase sigma-70 factor (ECF subfamily)
MAGAAAISYAALSDLEIAGLVARRDAGAVRFVTQKNNQRLFRAAWSVLRSRPEAEDAVQEGYIRAFAAIGGFAGDAALSTWLTRIVLNEALSRRRTTERRAALLDANSVAVLETYRERLMGPPRPSPESEIMRRQLGKMLEAAIARLPEIFRIVFVLREIEDLSVGEVAEVLQIPPDTVRTRFHRARLQLQRLLAPEFKGTLDESFIFAGADCERMTRRILERLGHNTEGENT